MAVAKGIGLSMQILSLNCTNFELIFRLAPLPIFNFKTIAANRPGH